MKTIKVYIGDTKLSDEIDEQIWNNPDKYTDEHVIVISPETFPKIFSKERIRVLKALEKNPKNMTELVSLVDRPREAVSRDLNYMAGFGLVDIKQSGKERIPSRSAPINVSM